MGDIEMPTPENWQDNVRFSFDRMAQAHRMKAEQLRAQPTDGLSERTMMALGLEVANHEAIALACTIAGNVVDEKKAKAAACIGMYMDDDGEDWAFEHAGFIEALTKGGGDG